MRLGLRHYGLDGDRDVTMILIGTRKRPDLNGIAQIIGEDSFVLGSDYPHGDPSRQEDMVAEFREREDLSPRMVEKMLSDNPRKLYGL